MQSLIQAIGAQGNALGAQAGPGGLHERVPAAERDWASLPHDLLAAVLHPRHVGKEARLVCTQFHRAYDAGVQRATLRLMPLQGLGAGLPRPPPQAPSVRLDASLLALGSPTPAARYLDAGVLAGLLQRWPLHVPLELDLSNNYRNIGRAGPRQDNHFMQALASAMQSATFAEGGVQVFDMSGNCFYNYDFPAGVRPLATALRASRPLSALRELRLSRCALEAEGVVALCNALQAATSMRSLTLLDLSDNSDMGEQGITALAACLRSSPHLASLQQLLLAQADAGTAAISALVGAIAEARLALTALDLTNNSLGDESVPAWAAALTASTQLAGLETLDLAENKFSCDGLIHLANALQAATHMTRLRRLSVLSDHLTVAAPLVRLLRAAPHLAGSIEDLTFYNCDAAAGAVVDVALAGVPRLRRLDLSRCKQLEAARFVAALVAGTHLTGLQQLDLSNTFRRSSARNNAELCRVLVAGFAASTHLSGLCELSLAGTPLFDSIPFLSLLRAAPHLRSLTKLFLDSYDLAAARSILELLPALRTLDMSAVLNGDPLSDLAAALAAALAHAACAPVLEELTLDYFHEDPAAAVHMAAVLQACTQLTGLRRLCLPNEQFLDERWQVEVFGALGVCRHLSGLQELHLSIPGFQGKGEDEAATVVRLYRALERGGQLAGTRVVLGRYHCPRW